MSRVMLSIRDLAAELEADPDYVLNPAEMLGLRLKTGSRRGELVVDVDSHEGSDFVVHLELGVEAPSRSASRGAYDDEPMVLPASSGWF